MSEGILGPILVATDLGAGSERAIRTGAVLAERLGAELHLIHSLEIEKLPPLDAPTYPKRIRQAEELLATRARDAGIAVAPASAQVVQLAPERAIRDRAGEIGAGLVVVGPHRGSEVKAHFLGTTADAVIRASEVPVLVVRSELSPPLSSIGVPTDFSAPAQGALDLAIALAGRLAGSAGGERTGVVVFTAGWEVERGDALARERLASRLDEEVDRAGGRFGGQVPVPVRKDVAWGVSTAETIARYAEFSELPLLVMGTHGESGLRRMITGSVASGVARQSACSVLLVPPGFAEGSGSA